VLNTPPVIIKGSATRTNRRIMAIKKAVGRPVKMNYKVIDKLADSIQHNASVTDACKYAGISRDTFYRYYKEEQVFADIINTAKENQNKVVMSFLTTF